jgi:NDP-sugar pyrophosphorylase family protein
LKAFIFAAGLGTRLQPITHTIPKALVPVGGKTLLDITISRLIKNGFDDITINTHHFSHLIIDHINKHYKDITIHISEEKEMLLDTGGGLKNAARFLSGNSPILVHNVDIVSKIDLQNLYKKHVKSNAIATLSVGQRKSSRQLLIDNENYLQGWRDNKTGEEILVKPNKKQLFPVSFNGIHVISPAIFDLMTENGAFPIIPLYLRLAKEQPIQVVPDQNICADAGTPEKIKKINKLNITN